MSQRLKQWAVSAAVSQRLKQRAVSTAVSQRLKQWAVSTAVSQRLKQWAVSTAVSQRLKQWAVSAAVSQIPNMKLSSLQSLKLIHGSSCVSASFMELRSSLLRRADGDR